MTATTPAVALPAGWDRVEGGEGVYYGCQSDVMDVYVAAGLDPGDPALVEFDDRRVTAAQARDLAGRLLAAAALADVGDPR
jgi:hypothetical protein